jgi:hypothetical protein
MTKLFINGLEVEGVTDIRVEDSTEPLTIDYGQLSANFSFEISHTEIDALFPAPGSAAHAEQWMRQRLDAQAERLEHRA